MPSLLAFTRSSLLGHLNPGGRSRARLSPSYPFFQGRFLSSRPARPAPAPRASASSSYEPLFGGERPPDGRMGALLRSRKFRVSLGLVLTGLLLAIQQAPLLILLGALMSLLGAASAVHYALRNLGGQSPSAAAAAAATAPSGAAPPGPTAAAAALSSLWRQAPSIPLPPALTLPSSPLLSALASSLSGLRLRFHLLPFLPGLPFPPPRPTPRPLAPPSSAPAATVTSAPETLAHENQLEVEAEVKAPPVPPAPQSPTVPKRPPSPKMQESGSRGPVRPPSPGSPYQGPGGVDALRRLAVINSQPSYVAQALEESVARVAAAFPLYTISPDGSLTFSFGTDRPGIMSVAGVASVAGAAGAAISDMRASAQFAKKKTRRPSISSQATALRVLEALAPPSLTQYLSDSGDEVMTLTVAQFMLDKADKKLTSPAGWYCGLYTLLAAARLPSAGPRVRLWAWEEGGRLLQAAVVGCEGEGWAALERHRIRYLNEQAEVHSKKMSLGAAVGGL